MMPYDISPGRMRLKKLARRTAVCVGRAIHPLRGARAPGIRVLTYHRFGGSSLDPCSHLPEMFESNLQWLAANAVVLSPQQFVACLRAEVRAPENAVLLSIDDGHASVAQHALPLLTRHGFRALLFICPGLVSAGGDMMGWDELRAASTQGHLIASHAFSHASLGRMSLQQACNEVDTARAALAEQLPAQEASGLASQFFAYPFGTRADWNETLGDLLVSRGYRYCFTSAHGVCRPGDDERFLPRIKIEGGSEGDLFPHIVRGCIDHWRLIDDSLCFLQQRGRP